MESQRTRVSLSFFYSLSYKDRLAFWDKRELDFRNEGCNNFNGEYFSLTPQNNEERLLFGRWMINHWRSFYLSGDYLWPFQDEKDDKADYRSFEELQKNYYQIIKKGGIKDRIIAKELKIIKATLKIIARPFKKKKAAIARIYHAFITNNENDLYLDQRIIIGNKTFYGFRELAKLWDIIKYKAFLDLEVLKLQEKREPNIKHSANLKFREFSHDQLNLLYRNLVSKKIMQTTLENFITVFTNGDKSNAEKIHWTDEASNHLITKVTLIELVESMYEASTASPELKNEFIVTYFDTMKNGNIADITKDQLKQTNSKGKSTTKNFLNIKAIIKQCLL